jgi:hypothetical protein
VIIRRKELKDHKTTRNECFPRPMDEEARIKHRDAERVKENHVSDIFYKPYGCMP